MQVMQASCRDSQLCQQKATLSRTAGDKPGEAWRHSVPPCCHCTSKAEVMFSWQIFGSAKVAASFGRCKSNVPLSCFARAYGRCSAFTCCPEPVGCRGAATAAESLSYEDRKMGFLGFSPSLSGKYTRPIVRWRGNSRSP